MKITSISAQVKNSDRVNISVDGKYRLSLALSQVVDLGVKVGKEYSEEQLAALESESELGKLYAKALEYCLLRPHSAREVRDYLWRKTLSTRYKSRSGEAKVREGTSQESVVRVFNRLVERGFVSDEAFARWWVENRNLNKGISRRKLVSELRAKGVELELIESVLSESPRDEKLEIRKVIAKKANRYDSEEKLMHYLVSRGFSYELIKDSLIELGSEEKVTR